MSKAQVISFYDIASWIILIIGMTIWIIILRYENTGSRSIAEDKVILSSSDTIFITLLRTKINGTEVSDSLTGAIVKDDFSGFKEDFGYLLTDYYSSEVCWKLFVDEKEKVDSSCLAVSKSPILDSTIYLPSLDEKLPAIKAQLVILGIKK